MVYIDDLIVKTLEEVGPPIPLIDPLKVVKIP